MMNKWITSGLGVGVAAVFLAATACGQQSDNATQTPIGESRAGGIEGTVTDSEGEPVSGMRVSIVSGTAAFPEIAPETDSKGYYRLDSVPAGTFEIAVHGAQGQRVGSESVIVTSGEITTLNISVSLGATAQDRRTFQSELTLDLAHRWRTIEIVIGFMSPQFVELI